MWNEQRGEHAIRQQRLGQMRRRTIQQKAFNAARAQGGRGRFQVLDRLVRKRHFECAGAPEWNAATGIGRDPGQETLVERQAANANLQ